MKRNIPMMHRGVAAVLAALLPSPAFASSHMDAPLITRDPSANTTDVYAFVQQENGVKALVTALGVYPHEEPGIGPNKYNFDDNVLYEIHVATEAELDKYTKQAITPLRNGYIAFAGQRDDGFYADIQSVFDLLKLRSAGKDSQGGYNIHLMELAIPVSELGGDHQVVGVYATTSRRQVRIVRDDEDKDAGRWVQVAREGNPLFNEGLVAIADKDLYSRTQPSQDNSLFRKYAENPELCRLINLLVLKNAPFKAPES